MILLFISFFITATLYASVGFGGGSTYSALLILAETNYLILPSIALICNIIVVSGGSYRFTKNGYITPKKIYPWIITSVPAAWVGGYIEISETFFIGLLGFSLLIAGLKLLQTENYNRDTKKQYKFNYLAPIIGAFLGLLSGLVGIGGGIILAPILYMLNWGSAKMIAGTCSIFILVNSLSGLIGQTMKLNHLDIIDEIYAYWPLFIAVFIGGQIGSYLGTNKLNHKIIKYMTAILILYVSLRLIFKWWNL